MKEGLIIKTEQSIPSLKMKLPEGMEDHELATMEQHIQYLFERVYRTKGVSLMFSSSEYLNFTIRTMNYDGECKTDLLLEAHKYFEEICKILKLEVA